MSTQPVPDSFCSCGRLNPAASGAGILVSVRDSEVRLLEALLLGVFEDWPCDACGRNLSVRPTVVFVCRDPQVSWFVLGSRMESHRERILAEFAARAAEFESQLEELPSLQALRAAVAKILIGRLGAVKDLLGAIRQNRLGEYLRANLAALTARTFATAYLACKVPQFRIKAERKDGSEVPVEELLEDLGRAQAMTWLTLWAAWSEREEPGPTLDEDLSRYIRKDVLLPSAVETALKSLAEIGAGKELTPLSSYCLEAIRASLCAAKGQPNTHATAWARCFFELELAHALVDDSEARSAAARLLVSEERARATITFQSAWDAALPYLDPKSPAETKILDVLERIVQKVGHPDLLAQIQGSASIKTEVPIPTNDVIQILRGFSSSAQSTAEIMTAVRLMTRPLLKLGCIEDLKRVGDAVVDLLGGGHEATAEVDSWLGSCCLKLRIPHWFLARVGAKPREWELDLPSLSRAVLWTERANALRLLGRSIEALEVIEEVLQIFPADGPAIDRRVAERNRAILLRDTGALDVSLEALERLLPQTSGEERIQTLDSLAMTYAQIGRYEDVAHAYDEATREARGPWADLAPQLHAKKAMALAVVGRTDEATAVLSSLTGDFDPMALLAVASAWATLLQGELQLPDGAEESIHDVSKQLSWCAEKAEARGDFQAMMGAVRLHAALSEAMHPGGAEVFWATVESKAVQYEQPLTALDLLELALYAYLKGETAKARDHLIRIPAALALDAGATGDLWMASQGQIRKLRTALDEVTSLVLEKGQSFDDVRLIAEMRRDVIGRAQNLRRRPAEAQSWFQYGLREQAIAQLALAAGHLAVVEWVETQDLIAGLVTVVGSDGSVSSHWLKSPNIEIGKLAATLRERLSNWRPGRRGEPFDLPDWRALEEWLVGSLSPHLPGDGHVVFIESQEHSGLPWHVAARRWPASYATSWTSMLLIRSEPDRRGNQRVGIVLVPRTHESEQVLQALRESAARTRDFAGVSGFDVLQEEDERRCDFQVFRRIMGDATVAKLLCHGFVNPAEREVALMLAFDGVLPLALSVASDSPAGRVHRLGWQQCRKLDSAPAVIFSAACSSGSSHLVGLGERLGLFAGLRHAGMRSMVAPRWDLFAEAVLPILDGALERYLAGETVAKALHAACCAAEAQHPTWLAWNLMLEGDWR